MQEYEWEWQKSFCWFFRGRRRCELKDMHQHYRVAWPFLYIIWQRAYHSGVWVRWTQEKFSDIHSHAHRERTNEFRLRLLNYPDFKKLSAFWNFSSLTENKIRVLKHVIAVAGRKYWAFPSPRADADHHFLGWCAFKTLKSVNVWSIRALVIIEFLDDGWEAVLVSMTFWERLCGWMCVGGKAEVDTMLTVNDWDFLLNPSRINFLMTFFDYFREAANKSVSDDIS